MSLFVGNLSPQVQHRELERTFSRFGRCNLELKDGYGFVIYETHREAERALRDLQGKTVCRERPSISWARRQRPFQRFSGKGNSVRRNSLDKDQAFAKSGSRRRRSQDMENVVNVFQRKGHRDSDQEGGRDGLEQSEPREDANENGTQEHEWKGQATTDLILEGDEPKESDPLDGGRWGELPSDGSPNDDFVEDARDYQEHYPDREKQNIEASENDARIKLHGSQAKLNGFPAERSHVRSSRPYHIAEESRRGRVFSGSDSFSKPQERCYNCGQLGHSTRQCWSRTNMNMLYRDGAKRDGFDGRRHQYRGISGNGFRRPGGRFRGIEGPRRGFNREMEASYLRRTLRRQSGDRRFHERVNIPPRARSRHRHHSSGSHSDSHRRERSKTRTRKLHKKSTSRVARKPRRSASSSKSSSSSRPPVRSQSAASHSRLSKPNSRSLGSLSRSLSRRSRSASLRSHSASRSSRSVSYSRSGRSQSKSHSVSSKSRTRSVSQPKTLQGGLLSPNAHGSPSPSSLPLSTDSKGTHDNSLERPARFLKSCGLQTTDIVHSVTLTDAKQIEYKGERLETVGPVSERSRQYGERQVSKRLRLESEVGTTEGEHQEGNDDSKRGNIDRALKDMEELRYSSVEQDEEEDLERSIVGSKDSRRYRPGNIGRKGLDDSVLGIEPSSGENVLSANRNASLEEAVKKQDTSTAGPMNDGLTIEYNNANQQAGRKVESPGVPALGGFFTKGAVHESILSLSEIAGGCQDLKPESFNAARLWPWEVVLHRRLKRGPISISNYERRKAQNEEFHIVDTFVRSSSGWWERTK